MSLVQMNSWHNQYRGRTCARIYHFLYYYCNFDISQNAKLIENKIVYHGEELGTFEWLGDTDIPYFTFKKEKYAIAQNKYLPSAIHYSDEVKPKSCDNCRNLKLKLQIHGIKVDK